MKLTTKKDINHITLEPKYIAVDRYYANKVVGLCGGGLLLIEDLLKERKNEYCYNYW